MIFVILVSTLISTYMSIMDDIAKKRDLIERDYQMAQEWIRQRRDFLNEAILRDNALLARSDSLPGIALKIDKQRKSFSNELTLLDEMSKSLTAKHNDMMKSLEYGVPEENANDTK